MPIEIVAVDTAGPVGPLVNTVTYTLSSLAKAGDVIWCYVLSNDTNTCTAGPAGEVFVADLGSGGGLATDPAARVAMVRITNSHTPGTSTFQWTYLGNDSFAIRVFVLRGVERNTASPWEINPGSTNSGAGNTTLFTIPTPNTITAKNGLLISHSAWGWGATAPGLIVIGNGMTTTPNVTLTPTNQNKGFAWSYQQLGPDSGLPGGRGTFTGNTGTAYGYSIIIKADPNPPPGWGTGKSPAALNNPPLPCNASPGNMQLWLRASDTDQTSDGGVVTFWNDNGGYGRTIQQTGAAGIKPLLRLNAVNGHPAIDFDGSDDKMVATTAIGPIQPPNTIFVVVKSDVVTNNCTVFDTQTGTTHLRLFTQNNRWYLQSELSGTLLDSNYGIDTNNWQIIMCKFKATGAQVRVSGQLSSEGSMSGTAMNGIRLGVGSDNLTNFFNGQLAELIWYGNNGSDLTHEQIIMVENYLSAKYNIPLYQESPANISGLHAWFKADAINTLKNGDIISQWDDSSGNGRHATASGSLRPTFVTNVKNGKPTVRFAISQSMATSSWTALTQPFTIIAVASRAGADVLNQFTICDGIGSGNRAILYQPQGSTTRSIYAGTAALNGSAFDGNWHVWRGEFNGASSRLLVDDTLETGAGNPGTHSLTGLTIGGDWNNGSGWRGDISEIMIFNRLLNSTEERQIQGYLNNKYLI